MRPCPLSVADEMLYVGGEQFQQVKGCGRTVGFLAVPQRPILCRHVMAAVQWPDLRPTNIYAGLEPVRSGSP